MAVMVGLRGNAMATDEPKPIVDVAAAPNASS